MQRLLPQQWSIDRHLLRQRDMGRKKNQGGKEEILPFHSEALFLFL